MPIKLNTVWPGHSTVNFLETNHSRIPTAWELPMWLSCSPMSSKSVLCSTSVVVQLYFMSVIHTFFADWLLTILQRFHQLYKVTSGNNGITNVSKSCESTIMNTASWYFMAVRSGPYRWSLWPVAAQIRRGHLGDCPTGIKDTTEIMGKKHAGCGK